MKNERTSKRVAKIAGKVMQKCVGFHEDCDLFFLAPKVTRRSPPNFCLLSVTVGDLKALAASCLTQTADKKPKPFTSLAEVRNATRKLRRYTVDAASIPELGETFADKPKRKAKRKNGRVKVGPWKKRRGMGRK